MDGVQSKERGRKGEGERRLDGTNHDNGHADSPEPLAMDHWSDHSGLFRRGPPGPMAIKIAPRRYSGEHICQIFYSNMKVRGKELK